MITEKHKNIYNCFLKHFRNGEPYQPRKDFTKLDDISKAELSKMYIFFDKFPHINWDDFFGAPRSLYPDEKCPRLGFFLTRAAIKSYNMLKQKNELRNPKLQIEDIRKSMGFIGMFCMKNGIEVNQYLHHKDALMYSWMNHYREHHINIYSVMEMGDVMSIITSLEEDERQLYLRDLAQNIGKMKMDYYNSPETKAFVVTATKKISNFVEKNLQTK